MDSKSPLWKDPLVVATQRYLSSPQAWKAERGLLSTLEMSKALNAEVLCAVMICVDGDEKTLFDNSDVFPQAVRRILDVYRGLGDGNWPQGLFFQATQAPLVVAMAWQMNAVLTDPELYSADLRAITAEVHGIGLLEMSSAILRNQYAPILPPKLMHDYCMVMEKLSDMAPSADLRFHLCRIASTLRGEVVADKISALAQRHGFKPFSPN